ncbi:division plane positioning ATPase MipZ [Candidatus Nucleicultrix amoebiphila]|uniref:division plane positioning ATPase MipZ n=1 Tax=Candidatus Nucleicultrix amoebiphila TaxID=1509244 RepID=UPI001E3C016A|nr:division plane positioning ATPase MipZ [Candidatus Nucleicultrix amoebiphila]
MSNNLRKPYVIVLGNEKGGTGKSTVSMHLITHLLRLGFQVGSIDVDARQGTLSRYIENRNDYKKRKGVNLPMPDHQPIFKSELKSLDEAEKDETSRFDTCLKTFQNKDFIVIDTPGSDSFLSRYAHSFADTLITPLNDSFIDLDMLGRVNPESGKVEKPSTYAEMVWDQKKRRAMRGKGTFDWIVIRNRLSSHRAKNKKEMQGALENLAKRIGFRLGWGLGERVIFRELFLDGLTLLDLKDAGISMTLSHLTARQELRALLEMIRLPALSEKLSKAS